MSAWADSDDGDDGALSRKHGIHEGVWLVCDLRELQFNCGCLGARVVGCLKCQVFFLNIDTTRMRPT